MKMIFVDAENVGLKELEKINNISLHVNISRKV